MRETEARQGWPQPCPAGERCVWDRRPLRLPGRRLRRQEHLEVPPAAGRGLRPLGMITSARSLFPHKVTFIGSRDQAWGLGVPVVEPTALRVAGSPGEGKRQAEAQGWGAAVAPSPKAPPPAVPLSHPPLTSRCAGTSLGEARARVLCGCPRRGLPLPASFTPCEPHQVEGCFLVSFCFFSHMRFSFFLFLFLFLNLFFGYS